MTIPPFVISPTFNSVIVKWQTHEQKKFNIFRMVSDTYYRENFHSDILKALLDGPSDSLGLFIMLLNKIQPSLKINPDQYSEATIEREPGKIDILIKSGEHNRCIIIENKINNAGDMNEQLSRYFNTTKHGWKLEPDAIVYLSADGKKEPSPHTYQRDNKSEVENKLVICAAFNNSSNDLVAGWLDPLQQKKEIDADFRLTIFQYIDLLKELGEDSMNTETKYAFLQFLKTDSNYKEAQLIAELFNNKIRFALENIRDRYSDESRKKKYNIVSARVVDYRGWMAQIYVKTVDYIIVIELCEKNGSICLSTYPDPADPEKSKEPAIKQRHENFKNQIIPVAFLDSDGARLFRWPVEEDKLIGSVDRILEFLQGQT